MAAPVPTYHGIPAVGLGCWMGHVGGAEEAYTMVREALKLGYRHIDTAFGYGNEEAVGRAIRDSGIPRSELFVTTKLTNGHHHRVVEGFENSIKNLGIGYVDLYLMHWPCAADDEGKDLTKADGRDFVQVWKEMEQLLQTHAGQVKHIGISNFSIQNLEVLLPQCSVTPFANQVEVNPYHPQIPLKAYCESKGIQIIAYGPLGQTRRTFLKDPEVIAVAKKYDISPAQVCISWSVQRGTIPIPKSSNPERLKQNITLTTLAEEDFQKIENLHKQPGKHRSSDMMTLMVPGSVWGWTMEEMGWHVNHDGTIADDQ
ncbi:putative GCY1-galactose-induced protein of aldo/keto reductase family [Calocera cornea HHB12733]|uniref:Putative GCY1-galactose-induced protein of aldo/keto reductase family n=1 Tax=Calocera cornea HHB12733 TaxID=1353952 RepID=A0A165CM55_9BASI|nr:putative GCY1-galactose-induced protein of aldo/keto reductase family [Calocera cornea HHB12733]